MQETTDASPVRTRRRRLGMTQKEFAYAIEVTASTVNRWEAGYVEPSRLARRAMVLLTGIPSPTLREEHANGRKATS